MRKLFILLLCLLVGATLVPYVLIWREFSPTRKFELEEIKVGPPRKGWAILQPERSRISLQRSTSCPTSNSRNFFAHPVMVDNGRSTEPRLFTWLGSRQCDIPCYEGRSQFADANFYEFPFCPHGKRVIQTMESIVNYPDYTREKFRGVSNVLLSTYDLDSDVPVPYFDWSYDIFSPKVSHNYSADMAVFISNCGAPNQRAEYLKKMMEAGLKVHSFGKCLKNKELPNFSDLERNQFKKKIASSYPFLCAFENSNTKDYVTEKFHQGFEAGTIPIHMGIPDIHRFAPNKKSYISVHDFKSPEDLVEYMKYLLSNNTAFEEYFEWKKTGIVSKDFRALMDLTIIHSTCRLCILLGDLGRWNFGWAASPFDSQNPYHNENIMAKKRALPSYTMIKARERGMFWFKALFLRTKTYIELEQQIFAHFTGWIEIYDITSIKRTMFDEVIHYKNNDLQISTLENESEIEIIFLYTEKGPTVRPGYE